eukprot:CAMPEP_0168729894 /NCGR_PEP_ID=MMETSP0724-20121128/6449_1 /TAXON_ID=265536 /ORGANISM="Amphiprora sp., Strain CCMP467" /LENGTH=302 /DNA_ID=CAMNT_0008776813 /DNA_START=30 /DNA_END=938 /DNA_ORIENTATION=-
MKVLIHYEDNEDTELFKSLKITLPKKWKTGPVQKLLDQFIETYNAAFHKNQLTSSEMHLAIHKSEDGDTSKTKTVAIASDEIVVNVLGDYADVYVQHGKSTTLAEEKAKGEAAKKEREKLLETTVQCTRFGCKNRFPKGGPYPKCQYHKAPPVFHETAKYWSCCPNKKAYDWETFQEIPGCETGVCTDVKESEGQKQFFGGTDLREQLAGGEKLKSIDDFNKAQAAGGTDAAPILDRLQSVMEELGIEAELYEQVVNGIRTEVTNKNASLCEAEVLEAVKADLGNKLKSAMKNIAAEQLRIK